MNFKILINIKDKILLFFKLSFIITVSHLVGSFLIFNTFNINLETIAPFNLILIEFISIILGLISFIIFAYLSE